MTTKKKRLELELDEYEHLVTTLEGAREEMEELEKRVPWFTSLTTERLEEVLSLIRARIND